MGETLIDDKTQKVVVLPSVKDLRADVKVRSSPCLVLVVLAAALLLELPRSSRMLTLLSTPRSTSSSGRA